MKKSIKRQLLLWLIIPLLILSALSSAGAYYLGENLARTIYDRELINSADSVIARLKLKDDKISVDLPPAARAILRHNDQDEFYFQILSPSGQFIAGHDFLSLPALSEINTKPQFRFIHLKDRQLRSVSYVFQTQELGSIGDHLIVQVAETRNTRKELTRQIALSVLAAQLILVACGAGAVWIGVRRGLSPLARVEEAVNSRSPGDLSLLDVDEPAEINSLVSALNRLLKQLSDDVEMQKRFIANAAHQLRTPIAGLGTYCDLARKIVKEPEAKEVLADLDTGISRMGKIVNRLLMLARSEPGAASTRQDSVVDLNSVVSNATASLVPEAIQQKIELEFHSASDQALISGDPTSLEELTANLIENSIMYGNPGGVVHVEVAVRNGTTSLTVEDNGPGIPDDEKTRVFERFYRLLGTDKPGTGLGLAIVKEIVSSHNAKIDLSTGAGGTGTAVTVSFATYKKN